jgi:hypothetical protein
MDVSEKRNGCVGQDELPATWQSSWPLKIIWLSVKRGMVGLVSKEYLLLTVFLTIKNYMAVSEKRNGWVGQDGIPTTL